MSSSGALQASLGSLGQLTGLYVEQNQLSEPCPPAWAASANCARLHLAGNPLSGPLPASLASLGQLWSADLRDTALCEPQDPAFQPGRRACATGKARG